MLRQRISALALGHHQVSNCASEETIQCIDCNEISLVAGESMVMIKITGCIRFECSVSEVGKPDTACDLDHYHRFSRYQRDLVANTTRYSLL